MAFDADIQVVVDAVTAATADDSAKGLAMATGFCGVLIARMSQCGAITPSMQVKAAQIQTNIAANAAALATAIGA